MARGLFSCALALATLLAGCGKTPTAVLTHRAPLNNNGPLPAMPAAPTANPVGGDATQILAAVRTAQQAQTGFTATVETFEQGPKDSETETLDVAWKRPNTLRIHILKATGSAQDAKVLWDGSESMKVKPNWLPFSVGVGIHDDRVASKNGWTIKQTDVSCILGVLLDAATKATVVGPAVIAGKSVTVLNVISPKSPAGVTNEQIGIDPTLNLPISRAMYKGQKLAYRLVAKNFKLGTPSAEALKI